ncbi:THUMP domain-containing protein, partial [Rhodopirellula sp. MGV]|uniref:THUMP domain-containing protein n=1 Tax=Rhodopirellula sp. MGV TaxID=2023130 RepID=UPI000BC5FAB3
MNNELDLLATCAFGLEAIVRRELQALGVESEVVGAGRLLFRGDRQTIAIANLHLRCADRVLVRIAEFDAGDFDALFETTRSIDWAAWLPREAGFPVTGRSIKSALTSVPAIQRSVKRAIAEGMMRSHQTTTLGEDGAAYKIDVSILDDVATLTIDTTGASLHRRGYRNDIARAPLRENLAAAMVLLSFWKPGRTLLDPFCGTGTIPIEAALIGRNIAPGVKRNFAYNAWHDTPADLVEDLRSQAIAAQLPALEERLIGSDIDGRVLQVARDNAKRAGVADDLHFERKDVRDVSSKRRFGCLIGHAPFASTPDRSSDDRRSQHAPSGHSRPERSQQDWDLEAVYNALPNVFRRLPTWSHYVFTSRGDFEKFVGRPADRRRKLYNGKIESTFFQFYGPKPVVEERKNENEVAVLVHADGPAAFGQLGEKADEQATLFAARLRKRARHLRRWPTRRGITCFRLYERDIPEIPLVVDRYEDHLHITEYERPHDRDPAQHANWLDLMATTAAETLDVRPENVHFKR